MAGLALARPTNGAVEALARATAPLSSLPVELEYRAHKLFFSVVTTSRLEMIPASEAAGLLRQVPAGSPAALPSSAVASLVVETKLPFGRHETARVLFDPTSGAVLQSERVVVGRRTGRTVTRYLREGIHSWRVAPANRREEKLGPEAWSARDERFVPYPTELPANAIVTDIYALLPLSAMLRLDRASPPSPLFVLSYHGFLGLDFTRVRVEQQEVELDEARPPATVQRSGARPVAVVRVSTRRVPASGTETPHELGVLGLHPGFAILIDATNGMLLGLTGRADYIGTITARLTRVRSATDEPTAHRSAQF